MPSSHSSARSTTSTRAGRRLGFDLQLPQEVRSRFKSGSHVRRSDPGLLESFQQARATSLSMCRAAMVTARFNLRCRQTPAFSIVTGGPVNKAFGDIIAVSAVCP